MADVKPLKIDPAGPGVPERFETGDSLGVVHGGTGKNSITEGALYVGGAGNTLTEVGPGSAGQVPTSTGSTITMQDPAVADDVSLTNANAGTIVPGTPVYLSAANSVDKARANAIATSIVFGLVVDDILTTAAGAIRTAGPLALTTGEWDAITGQTGGLTPGARYFLDSATAGELVASTPVDSTGNFAAPVGIALSTTVMLIRPQLPVGL